MRTDNRTYPEIFRVPVWPLILLFCVIALLLSCGGYWFYRHEAEAIKVEKYNDLKAIADLKINEIISWRQERMADARSPLASPLLRDAVSHLKALPDDSSLKENLFSYLTQLRDLQGYENVILATPDGSVLTSQDPRLNVLESGTKYMVSTAVSSHDAVFGDFFRCPVCGKVHLDVAAPLVDKDKQPLAVLILRTNPEKFLYPLIQSWPMPSKSAETLLVQREGDHVLFLNRLRHRPDPELSVKIPMSQSDLPAARAAMGQVGELIGKDYRGIEVLSDIRRVPGSPWFMVAKVDADEIFTPVRQRAFIIGFLTLTLVVLSGMGIAYIYKHRGTRLFQTLYIAERERAEIQGEFKTTLYSIGDAVITTDANGYIRQMNPVAEQLTEWNEGEAKGRPVEEVFQIIDESTGKKAENLVQKVLQNGMVAGLAAHSLLITKNGKEVPIADSSAPIRDEQENITGVVLVFRDQIKERTIEKLILTRLNLLEYAATHSLNELFQKTLDEVGILTKSPIGFYHLVENDQKMLSLQAWSTRTIKEFCKAEGRGLHYEIDQAGVWMDCVHTRKPVIHNDYNSLPHKKGLPEGHAPVIRELVVPIIREGRIVAILGVGNSPTDYTEKDTEIVSYFADVAWEIAKRKQAEESLKESERRFRELSIIDNCTQLYNSRHFYHQLEMEIDRVNRYKEPITLILLDVDNFKAFNDIYGHVEGNKVLMQLGQVIKRCLRKADTAYRYGGEEFIILLPLTKIEDGVTTAERIRTEFKKENFSPMPGKNVHVTLSIGVSQFKPPEEMNVFVHRVDQLMYKAKKNGKDRICYES